MINSRFIFVFVFFSIFLPTMVYALGPLNFISQIIAVNAVLSAYGLFPESVFTDTQIIYFYWFVVGLLLSIMSIINKYAFYGVLSVVFIIHFASAYYGFF